MAMMVSLALSETEHRDEREETIGPFDFVQTTYEHLYCGEGGPEFMLEDGLWYPTKRTPHDPPQGEWHTVTADTSHHGWSDITVSAVKEMFIVSWTGGYEAPQYVSMADKDEAFAKAKEFAADMDEGDTIDVIRLDLRTLTLERVEADEVLAS